MIPHTLRMIRSLFDEADEFLLGPDELAWTMRSLSDLDSIARTGGIYCCLNGLVGASATYVEFRPLRRRMDCHHCSQKYRQKAN